MAKVKFKTQANLDSTGSSRASGRRTGRKTSAKSGRVTKREEEAPVKKKGNGALAFLVFMILAGGGGASAYFYLTKQKEVTSYIVTKQESDLIRQINKRLEIPAQSYSQLNFVLGDVEKFQRQFTIPQVVIIDEQEKQFLSPNIEEIAKIKHDVVEAITSYERDKSRLADYEHIQQT